MANYENQIDSRTCQHLLHVKKRGAPIWLFAVFALPIEVSISWPRQFEGYIRLRALPLPFALPWNDPWKDSLRGGD